MIITNANIVTFNSRGEIIPGGTIEIGEGKIKAIKRSSPGAKTRGTIKKGRVIDAGGRVLMPGLVNLHMHLYSTFARGIALGRSPRTFLQILKFLWWRLDSVLNEHDIFYSALIPMVQSIRSGVTTIVDHHCSPNFINGALDVLAEAFEQAGLRGCLAFEVSDRFGGKRINASIEENLRFMEKVERWRREGNAKAEKLSALFGLHASFTLSPQTLAKCRDRAREVVPSPGFHIHCAEALDDLNHSLRMYGKRVVERLKDEGILGPHTIAAHCVHTNKQEHAILAKTRTIVAHNPRSNMNNAVGVAPVNEMTKRGVRVTLGTDGMSAKVQDDFLVAPLLQRISASKPGIFGREAFQSLVINNPEAASRIFGLSLGKIEKGAAADIILVDYFPPTPISSENIADHFFFGLFDAPVNTTIVGGKILMHDKALKTLNEREIAERATQLAQRVWKRL